MRRLTLLSLVGALWLLSGCAASIAYRADYVPSKPVAVGDRIPGRILIYTTRSDDDRLITAGATSFTGSGLKLTIPVGIMTREIAVKVFSELATEGANASNDLTDASRYTVILRPETKDLTHGFPQIQNLGFAITPQVHVTMRMSILDATGRTLFEKDYDSGIVSGGSYMISGAPAERINRLAHQAMYDLMRQAGDDVRIALIGKSDQANQLRAPQQPHTTGYGTGFAVRPDGIIVTSNHVIQGATRITVHLPDGSSAPARVIGASNATDLAVLKIEHATPVYLSLAPSRSVAPGTPVFTYGYPESGILGTEPKFTDGAVSSLSGLQNDQTYMQITTPVQPGNSGGPVVNDRGEVVGIVAAMAAVETFYRVTGALPQNVNWAVKADYAAPMFDAPPAQAPTENRAAAVTRTRGAICQIETLAD